MRVATEEHLSFLSAYNRRNPPECPIPSQIVVYAMPSLEGADAWLDRAEKHLRDLKTQTLSLAKTECEAVLTDLRVDHPEEIRSVALTITEASLDPPPFLGTVPIFVSVLIGEIVQAMRRSLDYLVYELAWLDSDCKQDGTQFPIEHKLKKFKGRRQTYLIGVNDKHAAAVKRLQPLNGVDWTGRLADLSNPDKHRYLTIANQRSSLSFHGLRLPQRANIVGGTGHWRIMGNRAGRLRLRMELDDPESGLYVEYVVAPRVTFEDGTPVIEILEDLKAKVADVLGEFRPCFVSQCHH